MGSNFIAIFAEELYMTMGMVGVGITRSDVIGALASGFCVVHCLLTPFLFIVHASSSEAFATAPFWWESLDFVFLAISFFAVFRSAQTTSKPLMRNLLWIAWMFLCLLVINETFEAIPLPELVTYVMALMLAFLHVYNLKYCQCKGQKCCTTNIA